MASRVLKRFTIDPYAYTYYIVCGEDELKAIQKKTSYCLEGCASKYAGRVFEMETEGGTEFCIVYLADADDDDTIWHECTHLVHIMMKSRGIPLNVENTEVVAYTLEYVVNTIRKELGIRKKKREKEEARANE